MGMFFDLLSAINDPNLQGNVPQLETSINEVQEFATKNNISPSTLQTLLSALGSLLQGNLRQQTGMGLPQLTLLLKQDASTPSTVTALQTLFPPQVQQQMVPALAQKTGLNPTLIQTALPTLIPAVMDVLKMGNPSPGATTAANPLLTMFLDGDRDGDTDLGDVFKLANRFIHPSQAR
ncbi:DUF937 domain-containing protein [filamentous cyanobacterium LEGE 07170]|nr:DUF937 domain-containing protein [filamentous cyanobacterium LEGE 07170]